MNPKTRHALEAINRDFYSAVAEDFSASRQQPWPGWQRCLEWIPDEPSAPLHTLDLGCGNGRFGRFLDDALDREIRYLGVDASKPLLEMARFECSSRPELRFEQRDVLEDFDADRLGELGRESGFDLVVLFGLLHHVPGFETRRNLLARAVDLLSRPGGLMIVTAWRFGAFERFRARVIDWETYNRDASLPIEVADLENGDHLLGWNESRQPRYCHFADRAEIADLLRELPVEKLAEFDADGRNAELNHYSILRRSD